MKKLVLFVNVIIASMFIQACTDHVEPVAEPESFSSEPFASGLKYPIGLTVDDHANVWVTEAGTGNNGTDGTVSMFTSAGVKTTFVTGLQSLVREGSIEGIGHLIYKDGTLYFLHGSNGMLYTADVSSFKSGDPAVKLADIPSQDLGTFVKSLKLTDPLNSNTYDLTFGPDDHLYIIDSGSNAVIKRDKTTGKLSLFAKFPNVAPGVEPVPTGIVYDGSKLLVSTLTGFPFAPGSANILQVDHEGTVNVYKSKFTTLTGITLSANNKPVVIQHGEFGPMGFKAKSGLVLDENGKTLFAGITRPTDIMRAGDKTYYLLSYQDGTISKLSY
ncbi:ScyD/ScyE family protein [Dyadobacter sp. CY343]|uniref:ScyD/ScyE family protein n=1 Tax=Dyadobacter sp. CY343 TaxID=2907299 RepID=UPI001F1B0CCB|nr:ScyD/ScyE family protein [Dyadobacter sp. CY343]MCE7063592.1 ScyD/ScyE family protein [Dyadobacter sp. CY343]